MRIGIDIDNVIANFNETLFNEYMEHDKELRGNGIINKEAFIRNMFDWTDEEELSFYKSSIERIAKKLNIIPGAKEYIDKIKSEGNLIYIITGRDNGEYSDPINMTIEWLDKFNINYDELLFTNAYDKKSKADICVKNQIDIMIDDSRGMCKNCIERGIKAFIMDTPYNRKSDIPRVHNWKEIYEVIKNEKESNS